MEKVLSKSSKGESPVKKKVVLSKLIMAASLFFAGSVIAQAAEESARTSGEGPWPVYAITYGKGTIMTSPDSETWTRRSSGTDVPLKDVEYGKETFVAVGGQGTIVTGSRDGSKWTMRNSDVTSDLWAVKFAKGSFVAVGSAGTVTSSPDGSTWTKRANLTSAALRNLAFGKDNFVAIGEMGSIFNSPDGIYWARRATQYTDHLQGITYGQGTFAAVGANGRILTSSDDGATWIERYSGTTQHLSGITYGKEKFVAVGASGTIVSSPDAQNWTTEQSGSQSWLGAITHGKLFVVVGNDGTVLDSRDGKNWSLARYGQIAEPTPTPLAKAKVQEPVAVVKPEPKVEKQAAIVAAEPKVQEQVVGAAVEPKVLAFEDIHFDFDKSALKPAAQLILKRNVQMLKDNPDAKVRIAGYTSASGTEIYNQALSERRASAVQEYLVNEGVITSDRLSTIGYGETNPAVYEASPKDRNSKAAKANMRVLFEIIADKSIALTESAR